MLEVVFQLDEKLTVITIDEIDLLLQLGRPEARLVGPVTLPLALTPRIAEPEQPHGSTLAFELMNGDE